MRAEPRRREALLVILGVALGACGSRTAAPYVLSVGAAPGLLECAAAVAESHQFEIRRSDENGLRAVKEILMTDERGRLMSRHREIVDLEITDTVNTPIAEIRASGEYGPDLADAISASCST